MNATTMQTPDDALSYITPIGYSKSSRCGYCGRQGKSFSYYAKTASLAPEYYQTLLDHYWRRSGTILYRPDQLHACCVQYTLRLDSTQFKPSRDQRQAVNRFNKFLTGDLYATEAARLHPRSREQAKKRDSEFDLVERIHEGEYEAMQVPPEPAHRFTVTLEEDDFTEEKYLVYENYQRIVHKEGPGDITRRGFTSFLCESPVRRKIVRMADGTDKVLGSFHQCYRLDGKLVAIGFLDLLPRCVSAVYFVYHESIHKFAPGKLGAIREIALAREAGYRYWYPGFYIHTCPKMRYKMDYTPQYVLDPETLTWDPMDKWVMDLLDKKPYLSLSREKGGQNAKATQSNEQGASGSGFMDESGAKKDAKGKGEDDMFLFNTGMPGVMTLDEIRSLIDMDHIKLRIDGSGQHYETGDLVAWQRQDMDTPGCLKGAIAELVAALGPDLLEGLCVDFR